MSELPTSPEFHPSRAAPKGAAQTTLTIQVPPTDLYRSHPNPGLTRRYWPGAYVAVHHADLSGKRCRPSAGPPCPETLVDPILVYRLACQPSFPSAGKVSKSQNEALVIQPLRKAMPVSTRS